MITFNNNKITTILRSAKSGYLSYKQLCHLCHAYSQEDKLMLDELLHGMVSGRQLVYDKRSNRYCLPVQDTFEAVVDASPRGFAFLIQQGVDKDMFVPARNINGALHRDTVLARHVAGTEDEAEIVSIVARGMPEVVGVLDKRNSTRFVLPDDPRFNRDIFIPARADMGAKNGQKVVVRITSYPRDTDHRPEGEVIAVLGYEGEHRADMMSVAHAFGIRTEFSPNVLDRTAQLPSVVDETVISGRVDYRDSMVITIDGADAKDLDDAISITRHSDGTYTLGVHIADVSHYVKPGSDIDIEALLRGTSTYLPDMVFPMLPTALSNGICSLFEGVDRLTLTCSMHIDDKGNVVDFDVHNSVINSRHRMTYADVQSILDGDKVLQQQYADIVPMLTDMQHLATILIAKRQSRGNINFDSKEVHFVTDLQGNVVDIEPYRTLFAHRIIEQFMVIANETTANYAKDAYAPYVYRVHDKPDPEKLSTLVALLTGLGIKITDKLAQYPTALQKILQESEDKKYYKLVNTVMLRTMQKAVYSTTNIGHYGLASECYCHFTSPIRRYPDLMVHRVLKTLIAGKMTPKAINAYTDMCQEACVSSNICERKADEAERKAVDIKVCQYAKSMVGGTYEGIISGVTEHGIFVELPNTVEGFVRVESLHGYGYQYNASAFCLDNGSLSYCLGDNIAVVIDSVNVYETKIDMSLANVLDKEH